MQQQSQVVRGANEYKTMEHSRNETLPANLAFTPRTPRSLFKATEDNLNIQTFFVHTDRCRMANNITSVHCSAAAVSKGRETLVHTGHAIAAHVSAAC